LVFFIGGLELVLFIVGSLEELNERVDTIVELDIRHGLCPAAQSEETERSRKRGDGMTHYVLQVYVSRPRCRETP